MDKPDTLPSPFHAGERHMHERVGQAEMIMQRGRTVIRDHMPDQHREFFGKLPFMLVGGLDARRQPWATVWMGPPGFMHSPDPRQLVLQVPRQTGMLAGDPLADTWHEGSMLGLLGIEPHTRRRNRMNGRLAKLDARGHMHIDVRQSFGNCPKYIVQRVVRHAPADASRGTPVVRAEGAELSARAIAMIERADVLFIASSSPDAGLPDAGDGSGVDVSHRGGPPGFVKVSTQDGATLLTMPDYAGNLMFNTLGNILLQPRVGLLFIDIARGTAMWLACTATVDTDSVDIAEHPGAQRLVRMRVAHGWHQEGGMPLAATPWPGDAQAAS